MKKKAIPLILLILILTLAMTSCVRRVGWVGMNYGGQMKANYHLFDGPQTNAVSLDAGDEVSLVYDITVESGVLVLTLSGPDRQVIWQEKFESNSAGMFSFVAERDGRYALTTTGQETKGSFDILWEAGN